MNKNTRLLLGLIIALAAFLRLFSLSILPPSLYWEEAAIGYDAYSILKTGKDYHGNILPLVAFPSFGDFKPSLYFYTTVPSIALFGLNEFAVRFPSALSGIITVYLVFAIARQLKFSQSASLLASLILAISPWHLQFSRAAFEANLATLLYTLGIYFFLKSTKNNTWLSLSAIIFALSMYAYHGLRILAPLTGLALFIAFRKKFTLKSILISGFLAIIITLPILTSLKDPLVNRRFQETSFFPASGAVGITNQLRDQAGNTFLSRIVYHRYWWWIGEFANNYFSHFNPNFLFISGDINPRHSTQEFAHLYHWEALTLLVGIYLLIRKRKANTLPLFIWIVLAPIPAALTKTTPHAIRFLAAVPAFALISAYGLDSILRSKKIPKAIFTFFIFSIISLEFVVFGHFYTNHYQTLQSQHWQYGYKQAVEFTESNKRKYDQIYFTREYGRPSIYVLFYGRYDPALIQAVEPDLKKDQLELLEFDNYIFTDDIPLTPNSLVVTTMDKAAGKTPLKTINFLDGNTAFVIYEQ